MGPDGSVGIGDADALLIFICRYRLSISGYPRMASVSEVGASVSRFTPNRMP